MKSLVVGLIGLIICFSSSSIAGVNLKNGNFYISYTDIEYSDDFKFTRTYNSKSIFNGMFGYGWGNDYDTYLQFNGDGSITVRENGGGSSSFYQPIDPISTSVEKMVEAIIQAQIEQGTIISDKQIEQNRQKLLDDRRLRNAHWQSVLKSGLVKNPQLPIGTKLAREGNPDHTLIVTPYGYFRKSGSETERFDGNGKLIRISKSDNHYVNFERNSHGHLRKVENHLGQKILIMTDEHGKVIKLVSARGEEATFVYDGNDLVDSFDGGGNRYQYRYDNNHNLTEIHYVDNTRHINEYNSKGFIERITTRNGDVTEYEYVDDDLESLESTVTKYGEVVQRYGTYVTKTSFNGRKVRNSYFYNISKDNTGRTWTSKIETSINGIVTKTEYHPCGLPLLIERGRRMTEFDYNNSCKLTYKNDGSRITKIVYDPKFGKIQSVLNATNDGRVLQQTEFEYDNKGNLTFAKNHTNKSVRLKYTDKGKIYEMEDEQGQTLLFSYNTLGKPEKIILRGGGSIEISYDEYGEIQRVSSPDGHKMSLKVTQMFQNLLSLVKPAGVNLNM
ncbi:DUF6531 domain-containing protein [Pleionea litopenaei]|uniref:DUF6531 domain-containing protein n=1 Tax=Pleionea litopenaei TaxID=3070815 RepID=A0AA51RS27_9GAMM|nr:DUF6531 domain-containing protein [Pleionea sp. HL-JVS1]WMS86607.1 DUF6531 domain-containing protein [Pleionea sp. HL-JVS1]